jgi:tetratricopeptide (TPR) repeat protein
MATDHIEQAVTCFQQSLLSPTHVAELAAYCYERLGFVEFYEQRDLKRALGFLNRAIDTYPTASDRAWLVQVHLRRSRVLRQMENLEAALSAAQSALSLASGNASDDRTALAEAQLAVGELLAGLAGRERETIACLQQFMTNARKPPGIDVTWSRVNEMLGDAYFNLARYEDAILAYRAALSYNPDHPWEVSLRYRIARCFYQQRAYEETISVIQSILDAAKADNETVDDYRIYSMLGGAQLALGHYEQAVNAYKAAIAAAPANEDDLSKIRAYYDQACELLSTIRS